MQNGFKIAQNAGVLPVSRLKVGVIPYLPMIFQGFFASDRQFNYRKLSGVLPVFAKNPSPIPYWERAFAVSGKMAG